MLCRDQAIQKLKILPLFALLITECSRLVRRGYLWQHNVGKMFLYKHHHSLCIFKLFLLSLAHVLHLNKAGPRSFSGFE